MYSDQLLGAHHTLIYLIMIIISLLTLPSGHKINKTIFLGLGSNLELILQELSVGIGLTWLSKSFGI